MALSDIPCPICGVASRHSHSDREIFAWIKDAARWMKDAAARIAELEALILKYKEVAKTAIEYREETQINICEGDFLDRALESVGMYGEADNG